MAAEKQTPIGGGNKPAAVEKSPVPPQPGHEWIKGSAYPNRPDPTIPDPVTLREQWRFATRQYARWYSHAWGTAILAGVSFFALGWLIKGSNPLPSFKSSREDGDGPSSSPSSAAAAASTE